MEWFSLGIRHIINLESFDHLIFVSLLILAVPCCRWSQIFLMLTCFTIGHMVSIFMAHSFGTPIHSRTTEILIALTITAGALHALYSLHFTKASIQLHGMFYLFIFSFGLIHGLGFAYGIQELMRDDAQFWKILLLFNLGVEFGQLAVAFCTLGIFLLMGLIFGSEIKKVKTIFFCLILISSLYLIFVRI
ncbi:MAG: HupE/UreJ family protein [Bacteroidia bacterium]|nr:HupE/UreJ family protein [Bacteroidia bacterium]